MSLDRKSFLTTRVSIALSCDNPETRVPPWQLRWDPFALPKVVWLGSSKENQGMWPDRQNKWQVPPKSSETRKVNPPVLLTVCGQDGPLLSRHLVYSVDRQLLAHRPAASPLRLVPAARRIWQEACGRACLAWLQLKLSKNRRLEFCRAEVNIQPVDARR